MATAFKIAASVFVTTLELLEQFDNEMFSMTISTNSLFMTLSLTVNFQINVC